MRALVLVIPLLAAFMARAGIGDSYFAPENRLIFKMVSADGCVRQFERDPVKPNFLRGADGWDGLFHRDGVVELRRWRDQVMKEMLEFDRGRFRARTKSGKRIVCDYSEPRKAPTVRESPLAMVKYESSGKESDYIDRELAEKWKNSGRFSFPFVNPNQSGALFAEIALILLIPTLAFGGWRRILFALILGLSVGCLLWCGSRGALLGFAVGMTVLAAVRFRRQLWSWRSLAVVAALGVVCAVFALLNREGVTRGFETAGGLGWSNAIRLDMWKAAPKMIAAAPDGWGFCGAGRAYMDWFQPIGMVCLTGSLMNDHLTWLVNLGTCGRIAYVFVLLLLLSFGIWLAVRRHRPTCLAIWLAFFVMAWFNPIFGKWPLWIVPAAVLCVSLVELRHFRFFGCLSVAGGMLAFSGMMVWALAWIGASAALGKTEIPVLARARQVLVNGENPRVWIVDDGQGAIGGVMFGKDIREYYSVLKQARPVGYVRAISDLPPENVKRLILVGGAGYDWLMRLSEDESARTNLPESVVFITPPFSPSEIPEGVVKMCNPRIVVGEFAARYNPEYANPLPWVTIVPGMEKYILRWMDYALEG